MTLSYIYINNISQSQPPSIALLSPFHSHQSPWSSQLTSFLLWCVCVGGAHRSYLQEYE